MEVVVWTDTFEEVAGRFGHGVEVRCSLGFVLRTTLFGRSTECLMGFPVGFLAVSVAVPLVWAFGAAFEGYVCLTFLAFGAGFPSRVHGRQFINWRRRDNGMFQQCDLDDVNA